MLVYSLILEFRIEIQTKESIETFVKPTFFKGSRAFNFRKKYPRRGEFSLFHEICQPKFCLNVALKAWIYSGIVLISNTGSVETGKCLWYVSNFHTVALIIFQISAKFVKNNG